MPVQLANQIYGFWKWLLSFRKRDWELSDYPVRVRLQKLNTEYSTPRFKQYPYLAYIVNWGLAKTGNRQQEAINDLDIEFETAKAAKQRQGTPLPRPGTHVPIEFASQEKVGTHSELAQDFIQQILELQWAWISDDSSLWDFHTSETNEHLYARITEVYGIDVSDIESAKLSEILDRIAATRTPSHILENSG